MQYVVAELYPHCVQRMWNKFHEIFNLVTLSREPSKKMCSIWPTSDYMQVRVLKIVSYVTLISKCYLNRYPIGSKKM